MLIAKMEKFELKRKYLTSATTNGATEDCSKIEEHSLKAY
jgi:hypothetical protein